MEVTLETVCYLFTYNLQKLPIMQIQVLSAGSDF